MSNWQNLFEMYLLQNCATTKQVAQTVECVHTDTITERGVIVCTQCGQEVEHRLTTNAEFKQVRCAPRRERSGIYQDIESMGLSNLTIDIANDLFMRISSNQRIFRGRSRRAVIFASVYYASWKSDTPYTPDELMKVMNISRRQALNGLKRFVFAIPESLKYLLTIVHTDDLVLDNILDKLQPSPDHEQYIRRVYSAIKSDTNMFSRSRPKTIISSILFVLLKQLGSYDQSVITKRYVLHRITHEVEEFMRSHPMYDM